MPERRPFRGVRAALALAAVLFLAPAPARGNMAEPLETGPIHAGRAAGEPSGGLRSVFIEHERLRIDLRPLADGGPADVEAVYRVRNDGAQRTLDLLFVADGLTAGEHGVWVDGRPVPSVPGQAGALPPSWRTPAATPALEGSGPLRYETAGEGTLAFRVTLPPGRHEIRVRYPADASAYFERGRMTSIRQLAYVLAPARDWAGFGGIEVRVELPRGWRAATEPALRREGNALVGRWDRIPADALAISVRQPEPRKPLYWGGWLLLGAAGLWALAWLGRMVGRALGERGRGAGWALPATLGLTFVWSLVVVVGLAAVPSMIQDAAGPFGDHQYGYGTIFLAIPLLPVLLVVGTAVAQTAAVRARRRALQGAARSGGTRTAVAEAAPRG